MNLAKLNITRLRCWNAPAARKSRELSTYETELAE